MAQRAFVGRMVSVAAETEDGGREDFLRLIGGALTRARVGLHEASQPPSLPSTAAARLEKEVT